MNIEEATKEINNGLVLTRESWAEKGYAVGLACDPISGARTLILTCGTRVWTGWQPADEDIDATDWRLHGDKPHSFIPPDGCAPREVL